MLSVVVYGYGAYSMRGSRRPAYTTHNSAITNQIHKQDIILTQDVQKTILYHKDFKTKPEDLGEFAMKIFAWGTRDY
jgi:hypothetical protein